MREGKAFVIVVCMLLFYCNCPKRENDRNPENRKIIEAFADVFYRQKDVERAFREYVSENYIQHNPNILDGRGGGC